MERKEGVLNSVLSVLDPARIVFLIQYGSSVSSQNPHDIDLFLVEKSPSGLRPIQLGLLDVLRIDVESFRNFAQKKDPAYATEAIVTGKLLLGDKEEFNGLREQVVNSPADVHYLLRRSFGEHLNATQYFFGREWMKSLISLNYAISYWLFAEWYQSGGQTICWKDLKESAIEKRKELIIELDHIIKGNEDQSIGLSEESVQRLINSWEDFILEGSMKAVR